MKKEINRTSEIVIKVGLDKEQVPTSLHWKAEDHPDALTDKEAKAVLLSIFDLESRDTLKIDIWTQDMQIIEMDRFMFQTLKAFADTYYRATNNQELANDMHRFAEYFGQRTEIIPTDENQDN